MYHFTAIRLLDQQNIGSDWILQFKMAVIKW